MLALKSRRHQPKQVQDCANTQSLSADNQPHPEPQSSRPGQPDHCVLDDKTEQLTRTHVTPTNLFTPLGVKGLQLSQFLPQRQHKMNEQPSTRPWKNKQAERSAQRVCQAKTAWVTSGQFRRCDLYSLPLDQRTSLIRLVWVEQQKRTLVEVAKANSCAAQCASSGRKKRGKEVGESSEVQVMA